MEGQYRAVHIGSGVWGVQDGATKGWKASNLGEHEAQRQAADLNIMHTYWGPRDPAERRPVLPPQPVEQATWSEVGVLDWWVRDRGKWWGRVIKPDGSITWVAAEDLRKVPKPGT